MHGQAKHAARGTASDDEVSLLTRYAAAALAVVGGLEWLLGRTVSRLAAVPTLEGTPREVIEFVGRIGLYLISPTVILTLSVLLLLVVRTGATAIRTRDATRLALCLFLAIFGQLALAHTFYPTLLWLNVTLNLLTFVALWSVAVFCIAARTRTTAMRVGVVLVALAYSGWIYYVLQQDLLDVGVPLLGAPLLFLNLGEIAAVAAPIALFSAVSVPHRQWRHPLRWVLPAIMVLVFSGGNIADALLNQGFMGVFAIWSLGMNFFLPWPLYAISGALFVYAVLTCVAARGPRSREANPSTGLGLLLLVFAGYALQLPFQFVMSVLSIALLSGLVRVPSRRLVRRSLEVSKQGETGLQQAASPTSGPTTRIL
ncbi:MAG: hypothetical protein QOH93_3565 [Chloroflexia bacterium]|jgi:hypothetical protein|nr:hypothetical protein [Chloroflexia bacterium]